MSEKWESGKVRKWEAVVFSLSHFLTRPLSAAFWSERRSVK
jgi:hypothetical protein